MCCKIKIFSLIILLAFSISSIVIYSERNLYIKDDCTSLTFLKSTFDVNKVISEVWKTTYQTGDIFIKQYCPSHNYESNLLRNDIFIARTDGSNILDCHGNKIYNIEFTNSSYIFLKGMCYSDNFNSDIINIKNLNGDVISKLNKNDNILSLDWTVTILDTTHPCNDPRIILLLIGKLSFKTYDSCNKYFWSVSWSVLTLTTGVVIYLSYIMIKPKLKYLLKLNFK